MNVERNVFSPPRPVTQYLGVSGSQPGGLALPYYVYDAHADSVARDEPEMYLVVGEYVWPDGRRFLDFAINPDWIETATAYTYRPKRPDEPRLRYPRLPDDGEPA